MITQETLEAHYGEQLKLSLVLFDEIEKASDALRQLLLGVLDKASLTLGDNRRVDFSRSVIFLTSNLGAGEMARLMTGGMGFSAKPGQTDEELDAKLYRVATEAARRKFSPEFMNCIDDAIVFRALRREELEQVLDIELTRLQERIKASGSGRGLAFQCGRAARAFLLQEGTDSRYGGRHLKRAIEQHLVFPLANLIATGQVSLGDVVVVDHEALSGRLSFAKESGCVLARGMAA